MELPVFVDFQDSISHLRYIWCWVLHWCLNEAWPNIIPNVIVLFGTSSLHLACCILMDDELLRCLWIFCLSVKTETNMVCNLAQWGLSMNVSLVALWPGVFPFFFFFFPFFSFNIHKKIKIFFSTSFKNATLPNTQLKPHFITWFHYFIFHTFYFLYHV